MSFLIKKKMARNRKLNINWRIIPRQPNQNERNCPRDRFSIEWKKLFSCAECKISSKNYIQNVTLTFRTAI